jgi:hypothetical protein
MSERGRRINIVVTLTRYQNSIAVDIGGRRMLLQFGRIVHTRELPDNGIIGHELARRPHGLSAVQHGREGRRDELRLRRDRFAPGLVWSTLRNDANSASGEDATNSNSA